jgi:hypothetical protein
LRYWIAVIIFNLENRPWDRIPSVRVERCKTIRYLLSRDSLACDCTEPIRPEVDAWVLDWITREPLKRDWFIEQGDGNCRLTAPFTARLSETAPMWARAVAPVAEWVARQLWSRPRDSRESGPPTVLTQSRKREAQGSPSVPRAEKMPKRQTLCRGCGKEIDRGHRHCAQCAIGEARNRMPEIARLGRATAHTPEARSKQGHTQRKRRQAQTQWAPSSQPDWLTERFYAKDIQPKVVALSATVIASTLGISRWYAGRIRQGYRPHPRHWQALARLVNG